MKPILLVTLALLAWFWDGFTRIPSSNKEKEIAEKNWNEQNFKECAEACERLLSVETKEQELAKINKAHCSFMQKDSAAKLQYNALFGASNPKIASVAYTQAALQTANPEQLEEAIKLAKEGLKKDPRNEVARFNYELLKKLKKQQEQQQQENQDKQDQDKEENKQDKQENKDNKQKDNKEQGQDKEQDKDKQEPSGQEQQKSEEQKRKEEEAQKRAERLKEAKLSEEQVAAFLEKMRESEKKYWQNRVKAPLSGKDPSKPDW